MSPILSKLYHDGYLEAVAYEQTKVFEAAVFFAKHETILPAPESAHAIRGAMDEALKCKQTGEAKTILFGLTGTGYFDMTAYESYLSGRMSDTIPTDADLQRGFDSLPDYPAEPDLKRFALCRTSAPQPPGWGLSAPASGKTQRKAPVHLDRRLVVAGAGFEPTTFGL